MFNLLNTMMVRVYDEDWNEVVELTVDMHISNNMTEEEAIWHAIRARDVDPDLVLGVYSWYHSRWNRLSPVAIPVRHRINN